MLSDTRVYEPHIRARFTTCSETITSTNANSTAVVAVSRMDVDISDGLLCQNLEPLHRNVLWYRGGFVFEAHRLFYHSA